MVSILGYVMALRTKSFRKLYTKDDTINRIQDSIKEAIDPVLSDLILNRAEIITTILTTDTVISHNLNRIPTGFIVTDTTTNSTLWRVAWDASTITLKASTDSPIKLFLF
jgi:hypothetical protein